MEGWVSDSFCPDFSYVTLGFFVLFLTGPEPTIGVSLEGERDLYAASAFCASGPDLLLGKLS